MSLKEELQTEQVGHLDMSRHCLVDSGTAVRDVLTQMRESSGHVCLITKNDKLVGIFTERDAIRQVVLAPEMLDLPIDEVMTSDPITITPDRSAAEALWLMDARNFRDLPVVDENGRILGNMTHYTIIEYLAGRYPEDVLNRPPRPGQYPRKAEGGD